MLTRRGVVGSMALGWPFLAAPAWAEQPPHVPRMLWPEVGFSWSYRVTAWRPQSAANVSLMNLVRLPNREFMGETCVALSYGRSVSLFSLDGRTIGDMVGDQPATHHTGNIPFAKWPMTVGSQWTGHERIINLIEKKETEFDMHCSVLAFEPVETPAGIFKAFHLRTEYGLGTTDRWWDPQQKILVKSIQSPSPKARPNFMRMERVLLPSPLTS